MAGRKPVVALLEDSRVEYRGRARAEQEGGQVAVVVKADGAVTVQTLDSGVKPQFYNPAGSTVVRRRGDRLHIRSESDDGEVLVVTGEPVVLHEVEDPEGVARPPRTRVAGTERDLVSWIQGDPGLVGLPDGEPSREVGTVGGRVDLQAGDVVVEVKVHADVRAYDQALRYLRDPGVSRVVVACLDASGSLRELCLDHEDLELAELDEEAFRAHVAEAD